MKDGLSGRTRVPEAATLIRQTHAGVFTPNLRGPRPRAKPMPLQAGEVAIDAIPLPEHLARKAVLERAMENVQLDTTMGQPIPILDATALCYMKLASPRGKDRDDMVGMLQVGRVDVRELTALTRDDPELRDRLSQALAEFELAEQ